MSVMRYCLHSHYKNRLGNHTFPLNVRSLGRQSKLTKFRELLNSFIESFKKMNPASEYAYFIINTQ